uniref:Pol-like protein n=1 Tax=Phallusia mammillata TaxID=59560 RepID=A0A6F9DNH7_9ASCI|nr:pol-like protein [Phallusia mammillata]
MTPSPSRHTPKTVAFADDVTLVTTGTTSLIEAFKTIKRFTTLTHLKLNEEKTQALAVIEPPVLPHIELKIQWSTNSIFPLNILIGKPAIIQREWSTLIVKFKEKITKLADSFLTMDTKAVLTKTILLPTFSKLASTYPIPNAKRDQINELISGFMSGNNHKNLKIPSHRLCLPREEGGYNAADIPCYLDAFYIRNVQEYLQHRLFDTNTTPQLSIIEYNIGFQLSTLLDLRKRNSLPHTPHPFPHYVETLKIIKRYKISTQAPISLRVKPTYNYMISQRKTHQPWIHPSWHLIHHPILPNYLKTFDYKLTEEIIPVKSKLIPNIPDLDPNCTLCRVSYENIPHLFFRCPVVQPALRLISQVFRRISRIQVDIYNNPNFIYNIAPPIEEPRSQALFAVLNTSLLHAIWKTRNKSKDKPRSQQEAKENLIRTIKRSLNYRLHTERIRSCQNYKDLILVAIQEMENCDPI